MGKQKQIPGMESVKNKVVAKRATQYAAKRDERIKVQIDERSAKAALITAMRENKLERYEDPEDDILVILEKGKENVKVKTLSEQDGDDDAGDDEGEEAA
jgi:hypothetical protein